MALGDRVRALKARDECAEVRGPGLMKCQRHRLPEANNTSPASRAQIPQVKRPRRRRRLGRGAQGMTG